MKVWAYNLVVIPPLRSPLATSPGDIELSAHYGPREADDLAEFTVSARDVLFDSPFSHPWFLFAGFNHAYNDS